MKKIAFIALTVILLTAILLTAGMLVSCGDGAGGGPGGDGGDPLPWDGTVDTGWFYANPAAASFNISTPAQLAGLAKLVNDNVTGFYNKTITQTADLDLAGLQWTPIGGTGTHYFSGTYDGNGKTISGLKINIADYYQGLFGMAGSSSTIKNVKLLDVSITVTGSAIMYTGAVAGFSNGKVTDCVATGSVSGNTRVGGVVGTTIATDATVSGCSFSGSVKGGSYIGGLAGDNRGSVTNCYAAADVEATLATGVAGGIVGNQGYVSGSVQYCYATGSVQGYTAGGIVGTNTGSVMNSAALNTGVTGTNARRITDGGTLANNYGRSDMPGTWNQKGLNANDGADVSTGAPNGGYNNKGFWEGLGWNFTTIWKMSNGNNTGSLPILQ